MKIDDIASIIGMVTGILGCVLGCFGFFHNRFQAVHQFLSELYTDKAVKARKHIHDTPIEDISIQDEYASQIVNFYHEWGLMAKNKYLPLWVFDGGNGNGTIRLYEKLSTYIKAMRDVQNDITYASGFEWLYGTLLTRRSRK